MTFSEVFERTLPLWPEEIAVSDGRPSGEDGYYFPKLSDVWSKVEDRINHRDDTWGSMMVWTMFQAFHQEAQRLRENGSNTLFTRLVDRTTIEERYFKNLHSEGWAEELAMYRRS